MTLYRMYFYDFKLRDSYPISINKANICDLAKWLNNYVSSWNMQLIRGEVSNSNFDKLSDVYFLPSEIENQRFITSLEERLYEYNKYHFEERGVVT